jgi:hypothetical protein
LIMQESSLMITATTHVNGGGLARYWPFAAGGLVAPMAAGVLARWIAFHFAVAATMLVAWTLATWLAQRTTARRRDSGWRRAGVSIAAGLAGALVAGVLAFLFPWM